MLQETAALSFQVQVHVTLRQLLNRQKHKYQHRVILTLRYCDILPKISRDASVQSHYMVRLKYREEGITPSLGTDTKRRLFT